MIAQTLVELVCHGPGRRPAVTDPGGLTLDYVGLCNAADAIGSALAARGVEPGEPVVAALPLGAAFIASFLGTAAVRAVFVPLGTVAGEDAAHAVLVRLAPRIVLAPDGVETPARAAAAALGIAVLEIGFDIAGRALADGELVYDAHDRISLEDDPAFLAPEDDAPLTHADLVAGARRGEGSGPMGALAVLAAGGHLVFSGVRPRAA